MLRGADKKKVYPPFSFIYPAPWEKNYFLIKYNLSLVKVARDKSFSAAAWKIEGINISLAALD